MGELMMRGDRLLLLFDVLRFLQWHFGNAMMINPRRFGISVVGAALKRRAGMDLQKLSDVWKRGVDREVFIYGIELWRDFIRANETLFSGVEVDASPLYGLEAAEILGPLFRAIASGEITEEMLKEPAAESVSQ